MTTDSGKKPLWKATLKNGEVLHSNNQYDFYDSYYNLGVNVAKIEMVTEPTPCANCERLEADWTDANEWIHKVRALVKATSEDAIIEIKQIISDRERLQKQLEMCKTTLKKYAKHSRVIAATPGGEIRETFGDDAIECLAKLEKE